jgi:imidazolonepropionase-like amidohydrolase
VAVGKRANLVVLNQDPLSDIGAMADIHCVIRGGALAFQAP